SLPSIVVEAPSIPATRFTWPQANWLARSASPRWIELIALRPCSRRFALSAGPRTSISFSGRNFVAYSIVYVLSRGDPQEGDVIASGTGWLEWTEWVVDLVDRYPEAAHLAEEGELYPVEALDELEHELEELQHEKGGPRGASAITGTLLGAVKARPKNCEGLIVTDGTAGEEEDQG